MARFIMQRETLQKSTVSRELYKGLARTMDRLRRQVEELLKVYALSEAQYNVLCILNEAFPKALNCGEIAAQMVTRDPDITRLLDRMEQRHLIERKRGSEDRRITHVNILPAGTALVETLAKPMAELHERQFTFLAGEETQGLFYNLRQIKQDVESDSLEVSLNGALVS